MTTTQPTAEKVNVRSISTFDGRTVLATTTARAGTLDDTLAGLVRELHGHPDVVTGKTDARSFRVVITPADVTTTDLTITASIEVRA